MKTGFRDYLKSEGIYVVKPAETNMNFPKSARPVKLLSVEGLKKALRSHLNILNSIHTYYSHIFLSKVGTSGNIKTNSELSSDHSKADKVTTNAYSQGIRFLSHVTGGMSMLIIKLYI